MMQQPDRGYIGHYLLTTCSRSPCKEYQFINFFLTELKLKRFYYREYICRAVHYEAETHRGDLSDDITSVHMQFQSL